VRIAGSAIVRQRPGTANGFVFLSLEDETGVVNAIVTPATFERYRLQVLSEPFLPIGWGAAKCRGSGGRKGRPRGRAAGRRGGRRCIISGVRTLDASL
jgi:DNA polymerase III alpha subunit